MSAPLTDLDEKWGEFLARLARKPIISTLEKEKRPFPEGMGYSYQSVTYERSFAEAIAGLWEDRDGKTYRDLEPEETEFDGGVI